jgi:hypothetical protein
MVQSRRAIVARARPSEHGQRGIHRPARRTGLDRTIIEASRDVGVLDVEFDEPSRWLTVVGQGSAAPYRTMQRFIATVDDHDTVGRLSDAHRRQRCVSPLLRSAGAFTPISSPAGTGSTTTRDSAKRANGSRGGIPTRPPT